MNDQGKSSASTEAMVNNSILPLGTKVLYSSTLKQQDGPLSIPFPNPDFFSAPPVVVTTPYWPGGGGSLPTETVINISTNGFQVISDNASANVGGAPYYVNWIAIGT